MQPLTSSTLKVFGLIDSDGGGSIDKDEFYELMCMVLHMCSPCARYVLAMCC